MVGADYKKLNSALTKSNEAYLYAEAELKTARAEAEKYMNKYQKLRQKHAKKLQEISDMENELREASKFPAEVNLRVLSKCRNNFRPVLANCATR